MRLLLLAAATLLLAPLVILALAIGLGGPRKPPAMRSISAPFRQVDFSSLPAPRHFVARDGVPLAYRHYAPAASANGRSVVLVHGSSASGTSMHPMALAFARAGYAAYTLDLRGHGDSGTRGRIGYVGQLEDDLQDFVGAVHPAGSTTLVGFSSGGGFALRVAGGANGALFDDYLLISPFLHQDAPTQRPDSGGWARVGLPRYIAVAFLDHLGITAFDDLPVVRFAIDDADTALLASDYSYPLAENFRPHRDYLGDIAAVKRPLAVLVGSRDEVFHADRFAALFQAQDPAARVAVVDGVDHIGMTLQPQAIARAVEAVDGLHR